MQRSPSSAASAAGSTANPLPFVEFVALIAGMMALTAFAIDIMLPVLPEIGRSLSISNANDTQRVIITYLLGFAGGQLIYGPLSDRFGRKPVLLAGLAIFIAGSVMALSSSTFGSLLIARAVQGLGAAAPRVIAVAVVRDLYSGRQMARVMSLAMSVFILVPVLAPSIGQALVHFGEWHIVFHALLTMGLVIAIWSAIRLPESAASTAIGHHPIGLKDSISAVVTNRQTVGYGIASGLMYGCLMGYVASAQQIFVDIYQLGDAFPIVFGAVASVMAVASFTNAQLVQRLGMRCVSHRALIGFAAIATVLTVMAVIGPVNLVVFSSLTAACFFLFGLIASNFNALAMEPQRETAGMASSLLGFFSTGAGALIGGTIGHFFNGSIQPIAAGFAALAIASLVVVRLTEGRDGFLGQDRSASAAAE